MNQVVATKTEEYLQDMDGVFLRVPVLKEEFLRVACIPLSLKELSAYYLFTACYN